MINFYSPPSSKKNTAVLRIRIKLIRNILAAQIRNIYAPQIRNIYAPQIRNILASQTRNILAPLSPNLMNLSRVSNPPKPGFN